MPTGRSASLWAPAKGFDTRDFFAEMREANVTSHVAQNDNGRRSAIDGRTTRYPVYALSLRIRKRIEMVWPQMTNSV